MPAVPPPPVTPAAPPMETPAAAGLPPPLRLLTPAALGAFPELDTARLPPAAAAWMAPLSPALPAAAPAAAAAALVPPSALAGLPHAIAVDQVMRSVAVGPATAGAAAAGGEAGALLGVTSAIHLPVSVDGGFICGLVATDVVLDAARVVAEPHPLARTVYDVHTDTFWMATPLLGGGLLLAAQSAPTPEGDAIDVTTSVFCRPQAAGGLVGLLSRHSTLVRGVGRLAPVDGATPLSAMRSAVARAIGAFGSASVEVPPPDGGGGTAAGEPADAGEAPPGSVVTTTLTTEYSSAAVVTRLSALVAGWRPVHPGGLRVGPAAAAPPPPLPGAVWEAGWAPPPPPPPAAGSVAPPGAVVMVVPPPRPPSPPRCRQRVRLEEVDDAAMRSRIVRNRESAARSNAKRRAARAAGRPPP